MRALGASRTSLVPGGVLAGPWVRNDLWRRARAVPSLDLRFADNKSLVDAVTGASLVTFTRAGNGTFVDSAGVLQTAATDVPRFDHNPTTGESLGLLVEESRTNLLLRSEEFQTTWALSQLLAFGSGSVADATTAPNGTLTADRITENSANAQRFVNQDVSGISASSTITASCYVKFDSPSRNFSLQVTDAPSGGSGYAELYLTQSGVVTSPTPSSFTNRTATVENVGSGWYRVRLTITTAAVTTITIRLFIVDASNAQVYLGNGTSGIYVWGAQLEAGAFPTSYIPTTTAAATRNADVASITGSAFSGWYRQDEGTMFADAKEYPFASTLSRSFYGFDSSATPNTDFIRQWIWSGNTTQLFNSVYTSSGGPTAAEFSSTIINEQKRAALAYKVNNYARSYNGGAVVTDLSGNLPVGIDRLGIGSSNNAQHLSGTIKRLTYWPTRLGNEVLQPITQ